MLLLLFLYLRLRTFCFADVQPDTPSAVQVANQKEEINDILQMKRTEIRFH